MTGDEQDLATVIANGVMSRVIEPGSPIEAAWIRMDPIDRIDIMFDAAAFVQDALDGAQR